MLSSPTRNDSLNFAQVTDYISSFSQRFLRTRACHLYLMDFFSIFWNRLELLCPLLPTVTNLLLNFATFWISLVLRYFLTYTLPLLYLSFPVSCDVLLSISGAGALAEAGQQIHHDLRVGVHRERSRSQTIRPSCRRTALSLAALCVGRSYHHPYLTGGETQCPEGKVASLQSPGKAQSGIQSSLLPPNCSLQEMRVPWQWVAVKKREISSWNNLFLYQKVWCK